MTTNDQENIERKLNHVLDMGERIIDLYPHITCTERSALLLAMSAASQQLTANMRNVAALLRKNLLDPFKISYTMYARRVEDLLKIWKEELSGAPIFHNLDTHSRPLTNPYDIALKEDTDYNLNIRNDDSDIFDLRVSLMKNASMICDTIENSLQQTSKILRDIEIDYRELRSDSARQDKRLKELEKLYVEEWWEEDKKRFISEVEEYAVVSKDNSVETYKRYLNRMDRMATDPHDLKVLAELNEWYLAGQRPASFIVENRDKLSIDDLAIHFYYVRCRDLITTHIESFDLLAPPNAEYDKLFINKAAQELVVILVKTISTYIDFRHNYQYAALQMALIDLGLVIADNGNGPQMMKFVNKHFLPEDEYIKHETTLTQWTGKLLGRSFGMMDEKNLQGNFTPEDFAKLKDYYWLCLSIINKVVQRDLEELNFAQYLYDEHRLTPSINDYKDHEGKSIMERLSILKSAIRGERLFS